MSNSSLDKDLISSVSSRKQHTIHKRSANTISNISQQNIEEAILKKLRSEPIYNSDIRQGENRGSIKAFLKNFKLSNIQNVRKKYLNGKKEIILKIYTIDDVVKHNQENDCWIVIEDNVYDISRFLEKHPGGDIILMDYAGKDATEVFLNQGHSKKAKKMLKLYKIGIVNLDQHIEATNHQNVENLEEKKIFPYILALFVLCGLTYLYFQNNPI